MQLNVIIVWNKCPYGKKGKSLFFKDHQKQMCSFLMKEDLNEGLFLPVSEVGLINWMWKWIANTVKTTLRKHFY